MPTTEARIETPYRVYVVRLSRSVLHVRRFVESNPDYEPGAPTVYVGSTMRTPEQRRQVHLFGRRHYSWFVRRFGQGLVPSATDDLPEFRTRASAEAAERRLAEDLRARGWGVWQR